jgi:hypothetical protein
MLHKDGDKHECGECVFQFVFLELVFSVSEFAVEQRPNSVICGGDFLATCSAPGRLGRSAHASQTSGHRVSRQSFDSVAFRTFDSALFNDSHVV